jgi:hypothetical protein
MASDFENIHDIDDLSDDELRELVRGHLAADAALAVDDLTVTVKDGLVRLDGRVGTEEEQRIAERIVSDLLGIESYENRIFVDPIRRGTTPDAVDEATADEDLRAGRLLGDRPVSLDRENELVAEDLDAELYGTTDIQKSIADGTAWIPPEAPTPEGIAGQEQRGESGEDH